MISVCMTSYNGEKFIKEQIDSILSQLSDSDELIISDDGSSDKTIEIIKKLDELNNNPDMEFIEIKNPEALEKDKYYNGKVICISNHGCDEGYWTCGKIYKFKDGIAKCDNGATLPLSGDKIKSYDELKERYHSMFLEIKE